MSSGRAAIVSRGIRLTYLTIGYNVLEAIVSLASGLASGSVALVSFGIDSAIEVTSAGAAQARLRVDHDPQRRGRFERRTHQIIGGAFLLLAVYVALDARRALMLREAPARSIAGIAILSLSVVVMPVLARAKRKVAAGLGSAALNADAMQTSLCAWLSAIALSGVALNAFAGWWWADPVAAIAMVPIIAREGVQGLRARASCAACS